MNKRRILHLGLPGQWIHTLPSREGAKHDWSTTVYGDFLQTVQKRFMGRAAGHIRSDLEYAAIVSGHHINQVIDFTPVGNTAGDGGSGGRAPDTGGNRSPTTG